MHGNAVELAVRVIRQTGALVQPARRAPAVAVVLNRLLLVRVARLPSDTAVRRKPGTDTLLAPAHLMYDRLSSSCAAEWRSRYGSNGKKVSSGRVCRAAARLPLCPTVPKSAAAAARAALRPGMRSALARRAYSCAMAGAHARSGCSA